jgi:cell division protein FtsB
VPKLRLFLERILPIAILGLALIAVPVMILSPGGLERLRRLQREREVAELEVSRLSQQIRLLREEVKHMKSDPAAVERAARDELGLVRKTEVVFLFDERH